MQQAYIVYEGSFQMDTENIHIIDEAYGFKSGCYLQTREGIVFSVSSASRSESYILKPCLEPADRKFFTYAVHTHLNENGFSNTDRILRTSAGGIFVELCGRIYTCSRLPQGRHCCVEYESDLKNAAALLAAMHNASAGFTSARAVKIIDSVLPEKDASGYVRNELGGILPLYEHRSSELARFKRLASRSRGRFDYEYLSIADYYCGIAEEMCKALADSDLSLIHIFVYAHFSDALKSHLQDFTYFARIFQRSVNIFMVKYLFRAFGRLYAFDDGKRNVRLQRHQLSVEITERNDIIAHKEIFVFHI